MLQPAGETQGVRDQRLFTRTELMGLSRDFPVYLQVDKCLEFVGDKGGCFFGIRCAQQVLQIRKA